MKKALLFSILIGLALSCDKKDDPKNENTKNEVVLLKVDFVTSSLEGGKKLEFAPSPTFTISSTYRAPSDFGNIELFYNELNQTIFDGSIIWNGLGEISYPIEIDLPNTFSIIDTPLPLPNVSMFEYVMQNESEYLQPDIIEYSKIWSSINNLEIVSDYLNSNPDGKINLFLYTPTVGMDGPDFWDWYIYLKN